MENVVRLTRELRVGVERGREGVRGNGFAGNPGLEGIGAFLLLRATLRGPVDDRTGMLVNIKEVDRVLREIGVPRLRTACQRDEPAAALVSALHAQLRAAFEPQ